MFSVCYLIPFSEYGFESVMLYIIGGEMHYFKDKNLTLATTHIYETAFLRELMN